MHLARRVLNLERTNTALKKDMEIEMKKQQQLAGEVCFLWLEVKA